MGTEVHCNSKQWPHGRCAMQPGQFYGSGSHQNSKARAVMGSRHLLGPVGSCWRMVEGRWLGKRLRSGQFC